MTEVFKPINGYQMKYFIGNCGTVKNDLGKVIKPQIKRKYPYVQLTRLHTQKTIFINTLLLQHFNKKIETDDLAFYDNKTELHFDETSFFSHYNNLRRRNYTQNEVAFKLENINQQTL
ncbi:MAG: hypothetical protein JWQ09_5844 [Segetibacter sp.]|nr:hypothetical protein [Segetibacter sp.]